MKTRKYEVDEVLQSQCSACGSEQNHTVVSVTKAGQITKSKCDVCASVSTYKSGVKVSVGGSTKVGSPYDSTRNYKKGQTMLHSTFGQGEVTALIEPQKIDVLFGDTVKRLIHARAAHS